jgi:hypothetical protein
VAESALLASQRKQYREAVQLVSPAGVRSGEITRVRVHAPTQANPLSRREKVPDLVGEVSSSTRVRRSEQAELALGRGAELGMHCGSLVTFAGQGTVTDRVCG